MSQGAAPPGQYAGRGNAQPMGNDPRVNGGAGGPQTAPTSQTLGALTPWAQSFANAQAGRLPMYQQQAQQRADIRAKYVPNGVNPNAQAIARVAALRGGGGNEPMPVMDAPMPTVDIAKRAAVPVKSARPVLLSTPNGGK